MIFAQVKKNLTIPNLTFQKDLRIIADQIFIPMMQENIHKQTSLTGAPFPPLEPETIAKKQGTVLKRTFTKSGSIRPGALKTIAKAGLGSFSSRTLIETGKLLRSFVSIPRGTSQVLITLTPDRKEIGEFLQIEGVGRKKKKFNFFGISKRMELSAMQYMRERIAQALKK